MINFSTQLETFLGNNNWVFALIPVIIVAIMYPFSKSRWQKARNVIDSNFKGILAIRGFMMHDITFKGVNRRLTVNGLDCGGLKIGDVLYFEKDPQKTELVIDDMSYTSKEELDEEFGDTFKGAKLPDEESSVFDYINSRSMSINQYRLLPKNSEDMKYLTKLPTLKTLRWLFIRPEPQKLVFLRSDDKKDLKIQ